MLNCCTIMGRLVADPELRHTQNNVAVTTFCLACDRDRKNEDGTRDADFIDIVAWRQAAEFAAKFFRKGQLAVVRGRMQKREYTDRDGHKSYAAEILAENFYFGESKKQEAKAAQAADGQFRELENDGELPF